MHCPVYLDHNATTPVDPRVLDAMLPYFSVKFGNAASKTHAFGWQAEEAVQEARESVGRAIGARPADIVFTSGATESNNLAVAGIARRRAADRAGRSHFISVATEHKSVLDPLRALARHGHEVTLLSPNQDGSISASDVRGALRPETALVSVMLANNEIGTVQPLSEIATAIRGQDTLLHCDATQALGKLPIDVEELGVDLLSLSAHKAYGPKGVGALFVRGRPRPVRLAPQILGGGHERGLRSGTLAVPSIVGFGRAAELASTRVQEEGRRLRLLAERLRDGLRAAFPDVEFPGPSPRDGLPGLVSATFPGFESSALLLGTPDVAFSTGSACTSRELEPSHVLKAIGLDRRRAECTVRWGIGRFTTSAEIDFCVARIAHTIAGTRRRTRAESPPSS